MFDINDNEDIKRYINNRKEGAIVVPLYVSQYGNRYALNELNDIHDYCPGKLKLGFVGCYSILEKYPFPMNKVYEVEVVNVFSEIDPKTNNEIKYIVFESSKMNDNSDLSEQINLYVDMIDEHIEKIVNEYRRNLAKMFIEEN